MSASVHTVAGTVMVVEHPAYGTTLALVDLDVSAWISSSDSIELDDCAFASVSTSAFLLDKPRAIRRIRLGVVARATYVFSVAVHTLQFAMTWAID